MKSRARFSIILILLFISFSLNSCISVYRSIVVNKDGSGKETMKLTFSKEFYSIMGSMASMMDSTRSQNYLDSLYSDQIFINKTKEKSDSVPGIKLVDIYSEMNPDSSNSFIIKYDFDSINCLGSSLGNLDENDEDSKTTVTWNRTGNQISFLYNYEQTNSEGMPDNEIPDNDSLASQMKLGMAEMFKDGGVHFEIEFPYTVISSNATSSDGNKLIWDIPLSDVFLNGKMQLEAVMSE